MSIQINKLTNANVYMDGASYLGRAEEVNLPVIKQKMVDHKGLGMLAEVEIPSGGLEKMEGKIKWSSFFSDVFSKSANPTKVVKIQLRGNLAGYNSEGLVTEEAYVCYMSAVFKENPLGNFKHLDNAEFESNLAVYSVKLEVGGVERLLIDVMANIYKVDGVDILANFRRNIGA